MKIKKLIIVLTTLCYINFLNAADNDSKIIKELKIQTDIADTLFANWLRNTAQNINNAAEEDNIKKAYDIFINLAQQNPSLEKEENKPKLSYIRTNADQTVALIYLIGTNTIFQNLDKAEQYINKAKEEAIKYPTLLYDNDYYEIIKAIKSNDTVELNKIKARAAIKYPELIEIIINKPLKKYQDAIEAKNKADKEAKDNLDKAAANKAAADAKAKASAAAAKDKADKDKAAAKDKLAKTKAMQALQAKQFKNVSDLLAKQAQVLQQFRLAQQQKNAKQINKLNPQINKIRASLNKTVINIKNNQGKTPLMVNPRIASIVYGLDKKRAKTTVNAKDKNGKTVLQYLIQSPYANNINLYKALIFAGVKITPNDIKAVQNKLKGKPALKPIVSLLQKSKK